MNLGGGRVVIPRLQDADLVSRGVGTHFQILILFSKSKTLLIRSVPQKIIFAS